MDIGWLVKTDSNGNSQWSIANSAFSVIGSVVQAPDGGFIVASALNRQACLIRTDASGLLLYNASYEEVNDTVSGYASSIVITIDGGYAVSGTLNHYPPTPEGSKVAPTVAKNVWLAKFAPQSVTSPAETPSPLLTTWIVIAVI